MSAAVDVVVVGGGIAGSATAAVMARAGHEVLVLERATEYRDRVRGEWLSPWGIVEAQRLGVFDALVAAGGHHVLRHVGWDDTVAPEEAEANAVQLNFLPGIPGPLCLGHPTACAALAGAAARAGANVLGGVTNVRVEGGRTPAVQFQHDGTGRRVAARLVVGADGRTSLVREHLGIPLRQDPPHHFFAGLLVEDLDWPADTETVGSEGDVHFFVFPQGRGRARLYLGISSAQRRRFAGPDGAAAFLRAFHLRCVPGSERLAAGRPAGPCAAYSNEDTWTDVPFVEGGVLVGDAAGHNDPIIGQGLSIALRDVRLVTELLRDAREWSPAVLAPYAAERQERMRRLRFVAALTATLKNEFGAAAEARRRRVAELAKDDPSLMAPLFGTVFVGPDSMPPSAFDESLRARLFG